MVLENPVLPILEWLQGNYLAFLLALAMLAVVGAVVGYLVTAAQYGPGRAFLLTGSAIVTGLRELLQISPRRTWAMARLAFQESMRRRVLVAFAVFVVGLLFAGWFLDRGSDHPVRLYLSFVLTATSYLVIILAIFLSSFSLPNDLKYHTIYTVVTKPVRAWEIVLGRILGFSAIGTVMVLLMGVFSYFFVVRGLHHVHQVDAADLATATESEGVTDGPSTPHGRTSFNSHHRHQFGLDEQLRGRTDTRMDHWHEVTAESDELAAVDVGRPREMLLARVPIGGKLRFVDRAGKPAPRGISVGSEWKYRSYIEGGTLAAAVWTFEGLDEADFRDGLPLEMTIRVFRSHKGDIERGILGTIVLANPNPDKTLRSVPINFTAREYTADRKFIPRKLHAEGVEDEIDLFLDLVDDGKLEVRIQCAERAQYFGMAQADVYLRAADRMFWVNFLKGYLGIWLQMVIVTCFGVMFSTFLSGPVAMLTTLSSIVVGYFAQFIIGVASGEIEGGGPLESLVRLVRQMNVTLELDQGLGTAIVKVVDFVLMMMMWAVSYMLPNYRGFSTTHFVASGFDIPPALMAQHTLIMLAYFLVVTCAAYFLFKTREIAA